MDAYFYWWNFPTNDKKRCLIHCVGKPADIHYGTGAISGHFSEDHVTVGDLVVENQVVSRSWYFVHTCIYFYTHTQVFLGGFPSLTKVAFLRNLLRQLGSPASHSWWPSLMAYLALDFKRFQLEMLYLCGIFLHLYYHMCCYWWFYFDC